MRKLKEMRGGGKTLTLESGQEVLGVFRGEPVVFYSYFNEQTKSSVAKSEPFVVNGKAAQQRFKVNFVTKEGNDYVAKIFSGSATVGNLLADAEEEYGLDTLFKIKRDGTGTKTKYNIMYKAKLTDDQLKQVNAVQLNDLEILEKTADPALSSQENHEDIPF